MYLSFEQEKERDEDAECHIVRSLLKKAKMLAASEDKSLSALIRESLEKRIRETTGYKRARARQLRALKKGYDLGTKGEISVSREDIVAL